jgi:5-methylcytosine-specific restriction protein A
VEGEQAGHARRHERSAQHKQRIAGSLRRRVRERARGCCEYCLLRDSDAYVPFHADHAVAEKHGGLATFENLAWACGLCNLHKGTDLASLDP